MSPAGVETGDQPADENSMSLVLKNLLEFPLGLEIRVIRNLK